MNYLETHLTIVKHLVEHTFNHTYKKNSIEDILWDIVTNCVDTLGLEDCVIYMYDKSIDRLVQKAAYGPKVIDVGIISNPIYIKLGEGITGYVGKSGIAEIIGDCKKDKRYLVDDMERNSEIAVPLIFEGNLIGVIDSEHTEKNFFTREHLDIFKSISSICAIKIAEMRANQKNEVLARFFNESSHPTIRIDEFGNVLNKNKASEDVLLQWDTTKGRIGNKNILKLIDTVIKDNVEKVQEIILLDKTYNLRFNPVIGRNYINVYSSNITDLKKAKLEAEKANEIKDKFLSVISHEIRTPLNAIVGTLNLLKSEDLSEKQLEYLKTTDYASDKLLTLLTNVLDVEKIKANKIQVENIHFNLGILLNNLNNAFTFDTQSKNNDLKFIIDKNVPQQLYGDETKLYQILINLLNNAVKFTNNGHIFLRVKQEELTLENCTIRFEISDTGIGIPEDKIESIFNPFQQAESSITRRFGGTGLGLSIAKDLVALLGGNLSVKSKVGEGTTFIVLLKMSLSKETTENNSTGIFHFNKTVLKGINILLVDDNKINLKIGEQFLKKWGATIVKAENGIEAVNAFNAQTFDLILMDIHMPICNGYEATKKIRATNKKNKDIPIVAITADVTEHSKLLAKQVGINAIISKPYKPEDFISKITGVLSKFN
jgi:signal transduction histidine kinase/CheY-like chemotaxis protein/putative methionine-R-sulfoxide reductase with GAF domain